MTDRGVSEALGYVLIFALVTGTIGLVFATGLTGLEGAQHEEKVQNIERAFDVLADNVEDLSGGDAPSRATEIKLAGGAVETGDTVTIEVRAVNDSNPSDNVTYTVNLQPIVYEDDEGTSIFFTSGAVLRSESAGAVMLHDPGWVIGTNRSVLPVVDTAGSDGGIAGDGAVLVIAERRSRTLGDPFRVDDGSTARVNVTVTSPRAEAWKRYFVDRGFDPVDADSDDDTVTYQFETDELYVPRVNVDVTFER